MKSNKLLYVPQKFIDPNPVPEGEISIPNSFFNDPRTSDETFRLFLMILKFISLNNNKPLNLKRIKVLSKGSIKDVEKSTEELIKLGYLAEY